MANIQRIALLSKFDCLGDTCPDTCCKNWSMQLDDFTLNKYKNEAPELLNAVATEEDGLHVMKRADVTHQCVKLEGGWCGIHKEKGASFLGDACYFYPRVTRSIAGETHMTATASCPEIVRLALSMDRPFAAEVADVERLPHTLKTYDTEDNAILVQNIFMEKAGDETIAPEHALACISNVARSLALQNPAQWHQSAALYLRLADTSLKPAQRNPSDPFNLLHMLCGLIVASHKQPSQRLLETIGEMEKALQVTLDWKNVSIQLTDKSAVAWSAMKEQWSREGALYNYVLRRFLELQLSLHAFPFAGLGKDASERITFIGLRFATLKLALMAAHSLYGPLEEEKIIRIVQSLSRILDHLGQADFWLTICAETGWIQEARLRATFDF
jgi:hypothetical protein